jgi:hypothetical protein
MDMQWIASPYSLPLDDLYAQDPACHFMHNDVIYVGVLWLEAVPEDLCYVVVPRGAAAPQRLRGSTVVTPVMPGPLPRYL